MMLGPKVPGDPRFIGNREAHPEQTIARWANIRSMSWQTALARLETVRSSNSGLLLASQKVLWRRDPNPLAKLTDC